MSDFFDQFRDVIDTADKLKRAMIKKGIKHARTQCPRCKAKNPDHVSGATLYGRLSGSRNHLHMSCTNGCGMAMME